MDFFVYEAVKVLVARWGDEAARSANTPADRSKRATQLSPGAALPALCLLALGRLENAVHGLGYLVYGMGRRLRIS